MTTPSQNQAYDSLDDTLFISADYMPSDHEEYMNPRQLLFFRSLLNKWKSELLHESADTIHSMQEYTVNESDIADRASTETDRSRELRARDRGRKLINKIDDAIRRIDDKSYGYCEIYGEPIGIARLLARPIATLSLQAQEEHERDEHIYRED